jgi:carotenoid cleavage dioxygenase
MGNPYLEGNFAPVREELTVTDLAVTGRIPEHLDGRYLRNGPNPVAEIDPATYHWFLGDGMVHGVRLRDGRAQWYRNRWVRSPAAAAALGEPVPGGPSSAPLTALGANTNVISHAGRTLALMEGGVANYELTDELDTVGPCDFDGTLPGGYTAHPKRDPDTGELHAVSYFLGRGNTVQYSVIGADGRARRTVDVEVTGSPMMHDFSLTENHVIFYDLPVTFDAAQATAGAPMPRALRAPTRLVMSALIGRVRVPDPVTAMLDRGIPGNGRMPYRWDPRYPARVGVMPPRGRSGGRPLVRRGALLRVPPAQRLRRRGRRGRHQHRAGRGAPPEDVRHRLPRPRRGPADAGPLDGRPGRGQGPRGAVGRPAAGVPPGGRAAGRAAAPLRLRDAHGGRNRRAGR